MKRWTAPARRGETREDDLSRFGRRGGRRGGRWSRGLGLALAAGGALFSAACQDILGSTALSYEVSARVDGRTLDESVLIRQDQAIQPYFINSIAGDNDVAGLRMFWRTSQGVRVGEVTSYVFVSPEPPARRRSEAGGTSDEDGAPGTDVTGLEPVGGGDPWTSDDPGAGDDDPGAGDDDPGTDEGGDLGTGEGDDLGTGEGEDPGTDESDDPGTGEGEDPGTDESGDPGTGEGDDLGTDAGEDLGTGEGDDLGTDAGEDPGAGEAAGQEPETGERTIRVTDGMLPGVTAPEGLERGAYWLVFQVLGKGGKVLASNERAVYYLGTRNYGLTDLAAYAPERFVGAPVFLPGTPVLLEVGLEGSEGLDPYVVWYHGKTRIAAGRLADGASRLIWTAPDRAAFQQIRVEALPFPPEPGMPGSLGASATASLGGKVKELSLPVVAKGEVRGALTGALGARGEKNLFYYYKLRGDLTDSLSAAADRALTPWDTVKGAARGAPGSAAAAPQATWLPAGHAYGLAAGAGEVYRAPSGALSRRAGERGRGAILFSLKSLGEGTLFFARFGTPGPDAGWVELELSREGGEMVLAFQALGEAEPGDEVPTEAEMRAPVPGGEEFATLEVSFSLWDGGFSAGWGGEELSVVLGNPVDSQCLFLLGGKPQDAAPQTTSPLLILDELALVYGVEPETTDG